jgi:hypothetical protein
MRSRAQIRQTSSTSAPLPKLPAPPQKGRSGCPPIPTFKDIGREAGLTASHIGAPEAHYVIDSTRGGVAGGDRLVTLYHQEADGTSKDITKEAGLARRGWSMGVAVADYDK